MSAIRPGPSSIHGTGLFAQEARLRGETLCRYQGPVTDRPPPPIGGMTFALEVGPGRWIDGSGPANEARHANHSCEPSAEARLEGEEVALVALRDIRPGDEITLDYGFGLADALGHPCRCGAAGCVGRIVAAPLRPLLRRHLRATPTGD